MNTEMIFETHAHYDDEAFDADRDELLSSFPENGIGRVINASSSAESIKKTLELTEKYPFIYGAVGIHPDDCGSLNEEIFEDIAMLCELPKTAAVGEVGLDYYWHSDNKKEQKDWFARFIDLAYEKGLPLIIHSRDAAEDTLDIVKSSRAADTGAVMHCYSYSREMAKLFLDLGLYFGIGGVATFKNARKLVETLEYIPMSSILLETDCPYLAPVPYRGKRNCSLYIPYVAERIAQIKGITKQEVISTAAENAFRLFKKAV